MRFRTINGRSAEHNGRPFLVAFPSLSGVDLYSVMFYGSFHNRIS